MVVAAATSALLKSLPELFLLPLLPILVLVLLLESLLLLLYHYCYYCASLILASAALGHLPHSRADEEHVFTWIAVPPATAEFLDTIGGLAFGLESWSSACFG